MSQNYYAEIYLHLTWHTKDNAPMLANRAIEELTHNKLAGIVAETPGARVYEVGGTDNHVHLAVSVPPTIRPSEWIGKLKGKSSRLVNVARLLDHRSLEWQGGYGVVSFGARGLEWVTAYIRNQRQHHARGTSVERLERVDQREETYEPEGDS